ncbi:MAG: Gmad2 immunoglobulin-like domain-containing protein [Actinomycetota bacterium]|nr:Gmad2 immunoglobulin-like domain-containing protein [Actinomycetota bacterium]
MTPEIDPGRPSDLEPRLRQRLHEEAAAMTPEERLGEIRHEVGRQRRRPDWLWPLASAAAVALVAVGLWATLGRGTSQPLVVTAPTTPVATSTPTPTASSTTAPTTTPPTGNTSAPPTATAPPGEPVGATALPVYFVEPVTSGRWGLVREFVFTSSGVRLGTVEAAQEAARLSMTATPRQATAPAVRAWDPTTSVTVARRGVEIDVLLSQAGRAGLAEEQQRLAVQQLVWAVTAGLQDNAPVAVVIATGGPIFEKEPAGVYKRPAPTQAFRDVAPIWIDSPATGSRIAVGKEVTVTGQACTFEAAVSWVLERDGQQVRTGHTTASAGCPALGSWTARLGALPAGYYQFRARELSMKDGSARGEQLVSFTVA